MFTLLKREGIPTTIHMGEVPNERVLTSPCACPSDVYSEKTDTDDILLYQPQRIGHGLYLVLIIFCIVIYSQRATFNSSSIIRFL